MEKISKDYDFSSSAMDVALILADSDRCLAYTEVITDPYGELTNRTSMRILDVEKLRNFTTYYNETEPDCARNYFMGYSAKVEIVDYDVGYEYESSENESIVEEMAELLTNKGTVFVIDTSGSMKDRLDDIRKVDCVKRFLDMFVDYLQPGHEISIVAYGMDGEWDKSECYEPGGKNAGGDCGAEVIIQPTVIAGNEMNLKSVVEANINADGNTPISHGLLLGYETAISNNFTDIVVLTDGCENCGGNMVCVAQNRAHLGIKVHTIGFGSKICEGGETDNCVCDDRLNETAAITGGEHYVATTCEQLVKPFKDVLIPAEQETWSFGTTGHSTGNSLTESVEMSLPVIIKRDEECLPGLLTLYAYSGDLESVAGMIEYTCRMREAFTIDVFIHNSMHYDLQTKQLCTLQDGVPKDCRKVKCDSGVIMDNIANSGTYKLYSRWENGTVRIFV